MTVFNEKASCGEFKFWQFLVSLTVVLLEDYENRDFFKPSWPTRYPGRRFHKILSCLIQGFKSKR